MSGTISAAQFSLLEDAFNNLGGNNITINQSFSIGSTLYSDIVSDISSYVSDMGLQLMENSPAPGVDPAVYDWISGAEYVNQNSGFFGQFIVDYTADQYDIRSQTSLNGLAIVAEASNDIAYSVYESIADSVNADGSHNLPSIQTLETFDAGGAAAQVFSTIYGSPDVSGWAGTLLFPFLGDSSFFKDFLLSPNTFTLPGTTLSKASPGFYDLAASLEAGLAAADKAGLANPSSGIASILSPPYTNIPTYSSIIAPEVQNDISLANTFFSNYYDLASNSEFLPGQDLVLSSGLLDDFGHFVAPNNTYVVGYATVGENITFTSTITTQAVIVGGTGNNTIVAPVSGDDLIDGGVGGMNTLDLSYVDGPLTIQMCTDTIESQLTITGSDISTDGAGDAIPGSRTIYAYDFNEITLDSTAASTFVTEGGETIGLNLTLAPSTQNPILQFSSGTSQSFNASTLNEVLVVSGMSDTLTAGSSNVTLINLNGGNVDFSGGNYSDLTEIQASGATTSSTTNDTFTAIGSGVNVLIGGSGNNTFELGGAGGADVIWGGGGVSTYDLDNSLGIIGIDILYTNGSATTSEIQNYASNAAAELSAQASFASQYGYGYTSGDTIYLIDPSASDHIIIDGYEEGTSTYTQLGSIETYISNSSYIPGDWTFNTYGYVDSLGNTITGYGSFIANVVPENGLLNAWYPEDTNYSTGVYISNFISGDLGISFSGFGPLYDEYYDGTYFGGLDWYEDGEFANSETGGFDQGTVASDSYYNTIALGYNQKQFIDVGGAFGSLTGGFLDVTSEQSETGAVVGSAGTLYIYTGGTATNNVIENGGTEIVLGLSEGNNVIEDGGEEIVYGGTDNGADIESGGTEYLSGGIAYNAVISGGAQFLLLGAVSFNPIITEEGVEVIGESEPGYRAAGTEFGGVVESGGVVSVLIGGTTNELVVQNGGLEILSSGGYAYATTINGGTEIVNGQATSVTVNFPGTLIIDGGTVDSANVNYLAEIIVSGGTAVNVMGWTELVESGGVISGSTDDASELVSSGGTDIGTTITAYAAQDNYGGTSYNDIVAGNGAATVEDGGIAYNTIVEQDGGQYITSGGTVFYTSVYGGEQAVAGGTEISSLLTDGAQINLYAAGQILDTTLTSGALLELFNSGTAFDTVLIGGTALDNYQGYLIDTAVSSGGTDIVFAGGTASGSMIYAGGNEIISGYSEAISTTVSQGGVQSVGSAGYAFGTVVQAGGSQIAVDGQINSSLIYGTAVVSSGGFAASSVITGGGIETISNGGNTLYDDVSAGGTVILAGGSASYGTVNSGGVLFVASNGQTFGMFIGPQGTESLSAGGTDQNAVVSGGALFVGANAVATNDVISSGGIEFVSGAGAYSLSTTILAGGTEIVLAGGTATDASDGGVLIIEGGGTADVALSGPHAFTAEANSQMTVAAAGASYAMQESPAFMGGSVQASSASESPRVLFLQMSADSVATVTGAAAGATAFNIVGDMTAGGASYTINDFIGSSSAIYLVNSAGTGPGDAVVSSITNIGGNALITLSDGTNITLTGLTTSALKVALGANGVTTIT